MGLGFRCFLLIGSRGRAHKVLKHESGWRMIEGSRCGWCMPEEGLGFRV